MNRRASERIVPMLVRAANEVTATIEVAKAEMPEDQLKKYAKAVGDVVFAIDGLLRPIVTEHPDLHP